MIRRLLPVLAVAGAVCGPTPAVAAKPRLPGLSFAKAVDVVSAYESQHDSEFTQFVFSVDGCARLGRGLVECSVTEHAVLDGQAYEGQWYMRAQRVRRGVRVCTTDWGC